MSSNERNSQASHANPLDGAATWIPSRPKLEVVAETKASLALAGQRHDDYRAWY
jgi:hypothetical protein